MAVATSIFFVFLCFCKTLQAPSGKGTLFLFSNVNSVNFFCWKSFLSHFFRFLKWKKIFLHLQNKYVMSLWASVSFNKHFEDTKGNQNSESDTWTANPKLCWNRQANWPSPYLAEVRRWLEHNSEQGDIYNHWHQFKQPGIMLGWLGREFGSSMPKRVPSSKASLPTNPPSLPPKKVTRSRPL